MSELITCSVNWNQLKTKIDCTSFPSVYQWKCCEFLRTFKWNVLISFVFVNQRHEFLCIYWFKHLKFYSVKRASGSLRRKGQGWGRGWGMQEEELTSESLKAVSPRNAEMVLTLRYRSRFFTAPQARCSNWRGSTSLPRFSCKHKDVPDKNLDQP